MFDVQKLHLVHHFSLMILCHTEFHLDSSYLTMTSTYKREVNVLLIENCLKQLAQITITITDNGLPHVLLIENCLKQLAR